MWISCRHKSIHTCLNFYSTKEIPQLQHLTQAIAENGVMQCCKDEPLGSRLIETVCATIGNWTILGKKPFTTNDPGRAEDNPTRFRLWYNTNYKKIQCINAMRQCKNSNATIHQAQFPPGEGLPSPHPLPWTWMGRFKDRRNHFDVKKAPKIAPLHPRTSSFFWMLYCDCPSSPAGLQLPPKLAAKCTQKWTQNQCMQ